MMYVMQDQGTQEVGTQRLAGWLDTYHTHRIQKDEMYEYEKERKPKQRDVVG